MVTRYVVNIENRVAIVFLIAIFTAYSLNIAVSVSHQPITVSRQPVVSPVLFRDENLEVDLTPRHIHPKNLEALNLRR